MCSRGTFPTGSSLQEPPSVPTAPLIQGRNSHLHCADEAAEAQRGHVTCSRSHNGSAPEPEPTQALTPAPGCGVLPLWLPSCCPGPGPQMGTPTPGPVLSGHQPPLPNRPHPGLSSVMLLTPRALPSLIPEPRPFAPSAPDTGSGTHRMSGWQGPQGHLVHLPGAQVGAMVPQWPRCASPSSPEAPPGPD